jgi:hypothetical protein
MVLTIVDDVPGLKPLHAVLRDKDDIVRRSVYEALAILQLPRVSHSQRYRERFGAISLD